MNSKSGRIKIAAIIPFIFCLLTFAGTAAIAQPEDLSPRMDASFQIVVLNLRNNVGEGAVGAGGRFGYRLSSLLYLDGEVVHFPQDPSGNFGETLGLSGIRIGTRFENLGVFAKARMGAIHFGGSALDWRLGEKTHPAIDLGAMLELYANKGFFLRMDLGDCIIPFGNTILLSPEGQPNRLGTKHNLLVEFGFGFRF